MANYEIKGKVIFADIQKLTDKEVKLLSKYVALGYTVEEKEEEETKKKTLKDSDILEYLKDNKEALETYKKIKDTPAVDKKGKVKKTSRDNVVKRGFNAGRFWFCKNFPEDIEDIKKAIEEAGRTALLEEAYEEYKKTKEDNKETDIMTETEYTRTYYWKYVF
jgi:hypothetical protein